MPAALAHVAPDPLEPAFDPAAVRAALRRRRTGVKRALLDQTLISGVGNIYADEALWRAQLHYARATDRLRRPRGRPAAGAVREVMAGAIAAGGTSFDALYVAVNGESGWFDRSLEVYGREGEPCSRCGTPIVREQFTNRSSYLCPHCQPRAAERPLVTEPAVRLTAGCTAGPRGRDALVDPVARARGGLAGWARNLDDGRVEVVAEGPEDACRALLAQLRGSRARRAGSTGGRAVVTGPRRAAAGFAER